MPKDAIRPELTNGVLDFSAAISWLEQKYDFNHRDYAGSHRHFDDWCNLKGYGKKDPQGNSRSGSQLWFAEYQKDSNGECKCPPYENFWHWLADYPFNPVKKGKTYKVDLDYWLGEFAEVDAPALQSQSDDIFAKAMVAARSMVSPELLAEYGQATKIPKVFPEFVKTILGYFKAEWGSKLKIKIGTW